MKVANFFDRTVTAALQVLQGIDADVLKSRLKKMSVVLAFDAVAASTSEGVTTLELATDLLARFYSGILLHCLDADAGTLVLSERLARNARAIHREIDIKVRASKCSFCLSVGATHPMLGIPTMFLGSAGWTAKLGVDGPVGSLDTGNPFGAAAAACVGVANAFRANFTADLAGAPLDGSLDFDVLHHRLEACGVAPILPAGLDLGDTHLVGLGAIGRAASWTLSRAVGLRGRIEGIDHDEIDLSNLQRYVGSVQADQDRRRKKTASAEKMFTDSSITFRGHTKTWGQYLAHTANFDLDRVAVALDTPEDRIAVQASLPRRLLNAWTQPGDLGVSHHDFLEGPCLACLYLPEKEVPSISQLVAEALGLPEPEIRVLLHLNFKVDDNFIARIAAATGVAARVLDRFKHLPLLTFYSKAVCGTAHFRRHGGGSRGEMAVPMAFQSALAGVLLAAEIIADAAPLRTQAVGAVTKINLLKPLGPYMVSPTAKHSSNRCLCQDNTYVAVYRRKHDNDDRPDAPPAVA